VNVDGQTADLYYRMLVELGGPYGRAIKDDLGRASIPIYEALERRVYERLKGVGEGKGRVALDAVDRAAIAVLVPVMLKDHNEVEWRIITGFSFDDIRRLGSLAASGAKG
jgi:hypothetical protein